MTSATSPITDGVRRRRLLDASLQTFLRFGYRKTSMEEVARAAQLSRQGLYLHFANKEDLFRATLVHALESGIEAASTCLRDSALSLEDRIVGGFDQWIGRYVGVFGGDVADIAEASSQLAGSLFAEHEELFVDALARVVRTSGLPAAYKPSSLSARQLADTLCATARGLKHSSRTRADFLDNMRIAVRAMCTPMKVR